MKILNWKRKLTIALASIGWLAPNVSFGAPVGINLVRNASFEDVDDFFVGPFTSVFVEEWIDEDGDEDDVFAYPYSSAYSGNPAPPGADEYHFTGGFNTLADDVMLSQAIDVSDGPSGELIATGGAFYNLNAFFSTYRQQQEASRVKAVFLDNTDSLLGSAEVGGLEFLLSLPITDGQRDWGQNTSVGSIPIGTESVEIQIISEGAATNYDGYLDLIDFQITEGIALQTLDIEIRRETGEITLSNRTGGPVAISEYSLMSAAQAFDPNAWLSIADNYDADSGGSVDGNNVWTKLSATFEVLNEANADGQSTLGNGQTVGLGVGTWLANAMEDLQFAYTTDGNTVEGIVSFIGNDGDRFAVADFNTDGRIDVADWRIFRDNQHVDLTELSPLFASLRGDLNGDLKNNHTDFVLFERHFDAANGPGAFAAMLQIPEPSSLILILSGGLFLSVLRSRHEPCFAFSESPRGARCHSRTTASANVYVN